MDRYRCGHQDLVQIFGGRNLVVRGNTFDGSGSLLPGGLAGLGVVVAAGAAGTLLAAVVTPPVTRRIGTGFSITPTPARAARWRRAAPLRSRAVTA